LCLKQSSIWRQDLKRKAWKKRNNFSRKFLTKTSDIDKIINVAEKKAAG
jgi:hypothetical protein